MRLVLALALALGAAAPPPIPDSSSGPTTLDAIVEDTRGRSIDSLGAADFSVTEQSRPVPIESVRFVRAAKDAAVGPIPISASTAAQSPNAGRVIGIYLDEFHVVPGPAVERVRAALIRFVSDDVGPSDLLVVLKPLD